MAEKIEFLTIGKILKPWGVDGQVKVEIQTDQPERFQKLKRVFVGDDARELQVERARFHSGAWLFKFAGYDTVESVESLRLLDVRVAVADAYTLKKGQYFHHQIIGLVARTEEGEMLGTVSEILVTGANDVYVVKRDEGGEVLLPAIREVIRQIDLDKGELTVHLIPGLV